MTVGTVTRVYGSGVLLNTGYNDNTVLTSNVVCVPPNAIGTTFKITCEVQGGTARVYSKDCNGTERYESADTVCATGLTNIDVAYNGRSYYVKFTPTASSAGGVSIEARTRT